MDKDEFVSYLQQIKALADKCLKSVEDSAPAHRSTKRNVPHDQKPKELSPDFGKPIRAFIKSYAKGMGGPAKFALLLSYLAKGDEKAEVASKDIEKQWSKMKSATLLGMAFHPSYPGRAIENDWVNSKKKGVYFLRPNWKKIFPKANG
ncbi:MAG: hypothetical protein ABFD52_05485 [Acidobacteriota bacterium]